jgi:hypothetical protein
MRTWIHTSRAFATTCDGCTHIQTRRVKSPRYFNTCIFTSIHAYIRAYMYTHTHRYSYMHWEMSWIIKGFVCYVYTHTYAHRARHTHSHKKTTYLHAYICRIHGEIVSKFLMYAYIHVDAHAYIHTYKHVLTDIRERESTPHRHVHMLYTRMDVGLYTNGRRAQIMWHILMNTHAYMHIYIHGRGVHITWEIYTTRNKLERCVCTYEYMHT